MHLQLCHAGIQLLSARPTLTRKPCTCEHRERGKHTRRKRPVPMLLTPSEMTTVQVIVTLLDPLHEGGAVAVAAARVVEEIVTSGSSLFSVHDSHVSLIGVVDHIVSACFGHFCSCLRTPL